MGLDWNPGPRAKPGFEKEWRKLWLKLHAETCLFRAAKTAQFMEISVMAFETLGAPRVGFDAAATEYMRTLFPSRVDKSLTEDLFMEQMKGFYTLDLVAPCDGLPRYTNGSAGGYVERYSFRAQFLKDCTEIIGEELLGKSYESKLPEDTISFGNDLLEAATRFATSRGLDFATASLAEDPDSNEFHLDVVASAGKWCRFWGERGHWLDAYF